MDKRLMFATIAVLLAISSVFVYAVTTAEFENVNVVGNLQVTDGNIRVTNGSIIGTVSGNVTTNQVTGLNSTIDNRIYRATINDTQVSGLNATVDNRIYLAQINVSRVLGFGAAVDELIYLSTINASQVNGLNDTIDLRIALNSTEVLNTTIDTRINLASLNYSHIANASFPAACPLGAITDLEGVVCSGNTTQLFNDTMTGENTTVNTLNALVGISANSSVGYTGNVTVGNASNNGSCNLTFKYGLMISSDC